MHSSSQRRKRPRQEPPTPPPPAFAAEVNAALAAGMGSSARAVSRVSGLMQETLRGLNPAGALLLLFSADATLKRTKQHVAEGRASAIEVALVPSMERCIVDLVPLALASCPDQRGVVERVLRGLPPETTCWYWASAYPPMATGSAPHTCSKCRQERVVGTHVVSMRTAVMCVPAVPPLPAQSPFLPQARRLAGKGDLLRRAWFVPVEVWVQAPPRSCTGVTSAAHGIAVELEVEAKRKVAKVQRRKRWAEAEAADAPGMDICFICRNDVKGRGITQFCDTTNTWVLKGVVFNDKGHLVHDMCLNPDADSFEDDYN